MIETIPSGTVMHGRYCIERVLGSGGFGHVYLAVDIETNKPCAVKEYLVTGTSGQEQLNHEAKLLSQLHHPNIPAFLDAFMEQERYYVVLNYIEGHDLTDLLRVVRQRNEVISIAQILQWMLAICDAVTFLHNQHPIVIHRDIKPDNIRIMSNGTAVLVDLGNAKAVADGARTLFFIRHQGTPGYAPPEQYPGGTGTDARSDVYALGGTLYFALTGHEPPSVSTRNQLLQQRQPSLPSLQERLANNPPENAPQGNELRQFRLGVTKPGKPAPRHLKHVAQLGTLPPELLKQLNQIIQRAMAIKPKDRYQFVADFANELKRILAALPPPPQTPGEPHRAGPYATEPNLPERFEAIQATREQQNQGSAQAADGAAAALHCPRCRTQLAARASFCPRCGLSLGRAGTNSSSSPSNAHSTVQNKPTDSMPHMAYREQSQARGASHAQPPSMTPSTSRHAPDMPGIKTSGPQQAVMPPQRSITTITQTSPRTNSIKNSPDLGTANYTPRVSGENQSVMLSSTNIKIAITIAIAVILVLIIILLLATHGH